MKSFNSSYTILLFRIVTNRSIVLMFLLFFIFIDIGIFSISYSAAQESGDNFLTYYNPDYNIKMKYPSDWNNIDGDLLNIMPAYNNTHPLLFLLSPDSSVDMSIVTGKGMQNKTLDQLINETIYKSEKDIPGFKVIELNKIMLSGYPAYRLVWVGNFSYESIITENPDLKGFSDITNSLGLDQILSNLSSQKPTKNMDIVMIKNGIEYTISYAEVPGSSIGQYSFYLPTAQKMIDSIQIIQAPKELNISNISNSLANLNKNNSESQYENPIQILKARLAKGEITIDQYKNLYNILTSQ